MKTYIKILLAITFPFTIIIFTLNSGVKRWKKWNQEQNFNDNYFMFLKDQILFDYFGQ